MNNYRKKIWISRLAPLIQASGLPHLFCPFYGGMGHILTFHRVIPPLASPRIHNHQGMEVSPEHLEEVIRYFVKRDYQFFCASIFSDMWNYPLFKAGPAPQKNFFSPPPKIVSRLPPKKKPFCAPIFSEMWNYPLFKAGPGPQKKLLPPPPNCG